MQDPIMLQMPFWLKSLILRPYAELKSASGALFRSATLCYNDSVGPNVRELMPREFSNIDAMNSAISATKESKLRLHEWCITSPVITVSAMYSFNRRHNKDFL